MIIEAGSRRDMLYIWDNKNQFLIESFADLTVSQYMRKILLSLLLIIPAVSQASPWCLVVDENESCGFSTAEACYAVANVSGGFCRANYKTMGNKGAQKWCVVTATYRSCSYANKEPCLNAARAVDGGCVANLDRKLRAAQGASAAATAAKCEDGDVSCDVQKLVDRARAEPK